MQIDSPLFKAKSKYLAHEIEQYSKFVILDLSIIGQNPRGSGFGGWTIFKR